MYMRDKNRKRIQLCRKSTNRLAFYDEIATLVLILDQPERDQPPRRTTMSELTSSLATTPRGPVSFLVSNLPIKNLAK